MPYIGWQRKRLGQGGDRRLGLLKLQLRMRRCLIIFPGAGLCLRHRLHIFLGAKMFAARGKGWRAREKSALGNSFGARGKNLGARGKNLGARGKSFGRAWEGFVNKEPGNVPSCLRFAEIKQQRSANSGPHGSGQVPLFYV